MMRVNDLALLPPAPLDVAGPDCGMEAGDLVAEGSLRTAVILSLFLDRRAEDDDILPNGSDDRRGWWADTVAPMTDYGIGGGSASGDSGCCPAKSSLPACWRGRGTMLKKPSPGSWKTAWPQRSRLRPQIPGRAGLCLR